MNPRDLGPVPDFMEWQSVPVFVGTGVTESLIARPRTEDECRTAIDFCKSNFLSLCPRGSARSYGDAILNDGNVLLDMSRMDRILEFDGERGTVRVEAGARIIDVFARYHHLGYYVAASPTDSTISVGGAMGANVHGKESWRVGNFGDQVIRIKLLTANGESIVLDRDNGRELFLAVIGGMGLLGLVTEITLQLHRVPSPYLDVSITPADNLDALIEKLDTLRDETDFIVVWIDTYAKGDRLGRAVIHATSWVESDASEEKLKDDVAGGVTLLAAQKRRALAFYRATRHFINLGFHLQQIPVSLFNRFYYWLCSRPGNEHSLETELFLEHNFDKSYIVPPPDILCGPHGYTVQITIPHDKGREGMAEILELCRQAPCPPVTTILRLHRKDDRLISFSEDGYSLNVEFHPKRRHAAKMQRFMDEFIECGIRLGSKVHLPKDHTLTRSQFRRLFPNYERFLAIKRDVDPGALFQSDMYRRLFADTTNSGSEP